MHSMHSIALAEFPWITYKDTTYYYPIWSSDYPQTIVISSLKEIAQQYFLIYPFSTGRGISAIAPFDFFLTLDKIIHEAKKLAYIDEEWIQWCMKGKENMHLRSAGKYTSAIKSLPPFGSRKLKLINNLTKVEILKLGNFIIKRRKEQANIKFPRELIKCLNRNF